MRAEERRQAIRELLQNSKQPVSASVLAARFAVSRQIIVGDIALLRAAGAEISATPRGYVILRETAGLVRQVAVQHDAAGMEAELNAMVDQGCTALDVIVEHPIYGELDGAPAACQPVRCGAVPRPLQPARRPSPVRADGGHPPPHPLLPGRGGL